MAPPPSTPSPDASDSSPEERVKGLERRANQILLALFLTLATAFILSSTYQLVRGVYDPPVAVEAAPGSPAAASAAACRAGIDRLARALDRSFGTAATASDPNQDALQAFQAGFEQDWADAPGVESSCAGAPNGTAAMAALRRQRQGEEAFLRRETAEIGPLRHAVRVYTR